jgi:hypothetical protein
MDPRLEKRAQRPLSRGHSAARFATAGHEGEAVKAARGTRGKRAIGVVLAVGLVGMVLACSSPAQQPIIVPVPTPTPSKTSAPRAEGLLPSGCDDVVPPAEVGSLVGRDLGGQARAVPGTPDPKIDRTARLDCYYGLADGRPVAEAQVAIGLATYTDDQAAARRVSATVDGERGSGVQVSQVQVGPDQGTLLSGGTLTLVVAHKSTTAVVTVLKTAVPADQAGTVLTKLASRALNVQ